MAQDSLQIALDFKVKNDPLKMLNKTTDKLIKGFGKAESAGKKAFKNIASTGGKSFSILQRHGNKLNKNMKKNFNDIKKSTADNVKSIIGIGAAYLSVSNIIQGIDLAGEFAETQSKFDAVYGKSADIVTEKILEIQKTTRRGNTELTRDFANIGALMAGMGMEGEKSVKATEAVIRVAGDLASFHNLNMSEATAAVSSAMLGETEALKGKTGIIVMDDTMREYAGTLGVVWKDLNQTQKAQLRLNKIIEDMKLQGAVGDLERTSGSFSNLTKSIAATSEDLKVKFYGPLTQELTPALEKVYQWMIKNQDTFAAWGETLGKVGAFIIENADTIAILTGAVVAYGIAAAAAAVATTIMTNPFLAVAAGVIAAGTAFTLLYKNSEGFRDFANFIGEAVWALIEPFWTIVKAIGTAGKAVHDFFSGGDEKKKFTIETETLKGGGASAPIAQSFQGQRANPYTIGASNNSVSQNVEVGGITVNAGIETSAEDKEQLKKRISGVVQDEIRVYQQEKLSQLGMEGGEF